VTAKHVYLRIKQILHTAHYASITVGDTNIFSRKISLFYRVSQDQRFAPFFRWHVTALVFQKWQIMVAASCCLEVVHSLLLQSPVVHQLSHGGEGKVYPSSQQPNQIAKFTFWLCPIRLESASCWSQRFTWHHDLLAFKTRNFLYHPTRTPYAVVWIKCTDRDDESKFKIVSASGLRPGIEQWISHKCKEKLFLFSSLNILYCATATLWKVKVMNVQ